MEIATYKYLHFLQPIQNLVKLSWTTYKVQNFHVFFENQPFENNNFQTFAVLTVKLYSFEKKNDMYLKLKIALHL